MDTCIPSAKESCRYYDQARSPALSLRPKIEASWSKVFVGFTYMATHKIHRLNVCFCQFLPLLLSSNGKWYWPKLICLYSVMCCYQIFKVTIRIWTISLRHCIKGCPMSLPKFSIASKILDCCVLVRYSSNFDILWKKSCNKKKENGKLFYFCFL